MTKSNDIHGNNNLNSKHCDSGLEVFPFKLSILYIYAPSKAGKLQFEAEKQILSHSKNATKTVLAQKDEGQEGNKTFLLHSVFLDKHNLEILQ